MKRVCLVVIMLLSVLHIKAQHIVTGKLLNIEDQPVIYANILLLEKSDSSFVRGAVSDEKGHFVIKALDDTGQILLKVSSIGYEDKYLDIDPEKTSYQIQLNTSVEMFEEVVVTGKKELFEMHRDRMVINVGSAPSFSGNSGLQLLQKVPGLQINRSNNNIGMIGKGEVMVMIDNKFQRVPMSVLMSQLEGLRAENIERIELIHQPGAKYDVSGAAGILHIVRKKNTVLGSNGSVSLMAGYGQREKAGASLNLNHRGQKINLYGDYIYNWDRSDRYTVNHYREYTYLSDEYFYENHFTWANRRIANHSGNLGLDIDIAPGLVVGAFVNLSTSIDHADSYSESSSEVNSQLTDEYDFRLSPETDITNLVTSLNIQNRLNEKNTLIFDASNARVNFKNQNQVTSQVPSLPFDLSTNRVTNINFLAGKLDYLVQVNQSLKFESGVKGTYNEVSSNAIVNEIFDSEFIGSELFTGEDVMKERILAAYATVSNDFSASFNVELGIRYEHYQYSLDATRDENDVEKLFSNPFPIVRINKKIDSLNTIQLVFNRTVDRAGFNTLGLYFAFFDPFTIAYSNPQLQPAFSNNLRFSLQHKSLIFSLGYLNQKNNFFWYNRVDKENGIQISNPQNLDKSQVIEATINVPINVTNRWETLFAIQSMYQNVYDDSRRELPYDNDQFSVSVQINASLTISRGWSVNFDGAYNSPFLVGDQVHKRKPYVNAGIRKTFNNSSISLSFVDIGNSSNDRVWEHNHPALDMRTWGYNDWSERQVRVTYLCNFGNTGMKNKRGGIQDEELKKRL